MSHLKLLSSIRKEAVFKFSSYVFIRLNVINLSINSWFLIEKLKSNINQKIIIIELALSVIISDAYDLLYYKIRSIKNFLTHFP